MDNSVYLICKSGTHVRKTKHTWDMFEGSLNARKSYQEKCCTYAFDTKNIMHE